MKTIVTVVVSLYIASALSIKAGDPKTNWANNCAQCHGPDGRANTKMGKQVGAKDLTDAKVQASFSDAQATKSKRVLSKVAKQR
jgi:cytochrome c553